MLILSILAFFAVIFLLASITVTVAWMGFLKTTAEESDAARRDLQASSDPIQPAIEGFDSPLFRNERLSTLNFWDALLARFDFIEILRERIAQAELDWSVGRVTLAMLLSGTVALAILSRLVAPWAALGGAALVAFAPYGYILRVAQPALPEISREFSRRARFAFASAARRLSAVRRDGNDFVGNAAAGVGRNAKDVGRSESGHGLAASA